MKDRLFGETYHVYKIVRITADGASVEITESAAEARALFDGAVGHVIGLVAQMEYTPFGPVLVQAFTERKVKGA